MADKPPPPETNTPLADLSGVPTLDDIFAVSVPRRRGVVG